MFPSSARHWQSKQRRKQACALHRIPYTRDALDRLVSATGAGNGAYSQSYEYDRIGNIDYKSDVGTYSYTYSNRPHAVRSAGGIMMQYDDNGNMTQKVAGGVTLDIDYNYDNMPELVKKNSSNYVRFTYDGNGERVLKENLWTGSTTLYFGDAYEVRGTVGIMHLFGAGGARVVSIRTDGTEQCYHPNHLGSASVITDINGNLKERIEYYPFGTYRERPDNDPGFPNVNYTFTDQEDDDDLGLYNYNARLYDPVLGRFLSADTIVPDPYNLQSLNRYSYVLNDPISYIDPSGHDEIIFYIGSGGETIVYAEPYPNEISDIYFNSDVGEPDQKSNPAGGSPSIPIDLPPGNDLSEDTVDDACPYQLGAEYFSGLGDRHHDFFTEDPFTQIFLEHSWVQNLIEEVCNGEKGELGRAYYGLEGLAKIPEYFVHYSAIFTNGLIGNLAVAYLGSYDMTFFVDGRNLHIHAWNESDFASLFFHPPWIGYTPIWTKYIHDPVDAIPNWTGPMSRTTQDIYATIDLIEACGCIK